VQARSRKWTVRAAALAGLALAASGLAAPQIARAAPAAPAAPPHAAALPTEDDAVARADAVLRDKRSAVRAGADDAFTPWNTQIDEDGATHVRYTRTYKGLPVRGGDIVVHHTAEGRFAAAGVANASTIQLGIQPTVTATTAAAMARAAFGGTVERVGTPELAVDAAATGGPRLAWRTLVAGTAPDTGPSRQQVFIDALSGAVLAADEEIKADSVVGHSFHSGTVSIPVYKPVGVGGFQVADPSRPGSSVCTLNNASESGTCESPYFFGVTTLGNGTQSDKATAMVDAAYGEATTYAYYNTTHKRKGVFDNGHGVQSKVHWRNDYANARWDTSCECMLYGDGNNNQIPTLSLDVAGHEMTHGVTEHSVPGGLIYAGESGGLNESTSDIFGTAVEFFAQNSQDIGDYTVGEKVDIFGTGQPLRFMYDPPLDAGFAPGGAVSDGCWNTTVKTHNVHYSSGVGNHFFFLLAQGSGNTQYGFSPVCQGSALTGIGRDKAARIWYRALTRYFTSTTGYVDNANPTNTARAATLAAASDLFGHCGNEYRAVQAAWAAVSVFANDSGCFENRASGWVLDLQPNVPTQQPGTQGNTTGAKNTVLRNGAGSYTITFPGLAGTLAQGGMVQVNRYGTAPGACAAADWYPVGTGVQVAVTCADVAGAPADLAFIASFTRSRLPGGTFGYAWAGQPTTASYTASPSWSYNSKGGANRVQRLATGRYQVTFPGLGVPGGTVMATAQGYVTDRCLVENWMSSGADELVLIRCSDRTGAPVDAAFDVTFTNEQSVLGTTQPSGYTWVPASLPTGPTSPTYSFNSTGRVQTLAHAVGSGSYEVTFAGLSLNNGVPHVVSQSYLGGGNTCRISTFMATGTVGARVSVLCDTAAGVATDASFDLMWFG
jgi:Zn-dependent metalloprotease